MANIMIPGAVTLVSSNVAVTAYAEWNSATNYAINALVSSSTTRGEYKALVASTNKNPADPLNVYDAVNNPSGSWLFLGTQNKFAAFDQFFNTQTANAGTITMTVAAYGAHALFLGNIDAIDVTISVKDNDSGLTIEGPVTIGVITEPTTHEEYGYGDWIDETEGDITYQRTTLTRNISFVVTINGGAGTAKLGVFLAGPMRSVGSAQWGVELSSLFYGSVVTDTSSGVTYLSKGNSAKALSPRLEADVANIKAHYRTFDKIQGQPIVFIDDFEILSTYCYLQKFKQSAPNPTKFYTDTDFVGLI